MPSEGIDVKLDVAAKAEVIGLNSREVVPAGGVPLHVSAYPAFCAGIDVHGIPNLILWLDEGIPRLL